MVLVVQVITSNYFLWWFIYIFPSSFLPSFLPSFSLSHSFLPSLFSPLASFFLPFSFLIFSFLPQSLAPCSFPTSHHPSFLFIFPSFLLFFPSFGPSLSSSVLITTYRFYSRWRSWSQESCIYNMCRTYSYGTVSRAVGILFWYHFTQETQLQVGGDIHKNSHTRQRKTRRWYWNWN